MEGIIGIFAVGVLTLLFIEGGLIVLKILMKSNKKDESELIDASTDNVEVKSKNLDYGKFHGVLKREDIMDFLNFDKIKNDMIIRKNDTEFVMVLGCNGTNFYLKSENDKFIIEDGFAQFLNTLTFQIQLYIQTRSLDFTEVIAEYEQRLLEIEKDMEQTSKEIEKARMNFDSQKQEILIYKRMNQEKLLNYTRDTLNYTRSLNRNNKILKQNTYLVVPFRVDELVKKPETKEDLYQEVFAELYNRSSNLKRALMACSVTSRILNSEELVELIFNAFNRDQLENVNLKELTKTNVDQLYTHSQDIIEKQKEQLEKEIHAKGMEIALAAINQVGVRSRKKELEKIKKNKDRYAKERAKESIKELEYKMDEDMFQETMENVENYDFETDTIKEKTVKKKEKEFKKVEKELEQEVELEDQEEKIKEDLENQEQ